MKVHLLVAVLVLGMFASAQVDIGGWFSGNRLTGPSSSQLALAYALNLDYASSVRCSTYFMNADDNWACVTANGSREAVQLFLNARVASEPTMSWRSPWTTFGTSIGRLMAWRATTYQVSLFWTDQMVLMVVSPYAE